MKKNKLNTNVEMMNSDQITKSWQGLQNDQPNIRIREAATILNLSEVELLASTVGTDVIRLKPDWEAFLKRLPSLGQVMSLTRNEACVLEHKGAFEQVKVFNMKNHNMGIVIGPIETRIFLKAWYAAFAVKQQKRDRLLTSLQVFDHEGQAITKIYLQEDSNFEAYENLVNDFRSEDQSQSQTVTSYEPEEYDSNLDIENLLLDWSNLKDTHDFFPLLKKYKVQRFQAIKVAQDKFTYPVEIASVQTMLERASKHKLPIMIFAGNTGNLQIHQDKVRTIRLLERGENKEIKWLNVLDPNFNMHLRIDLVKAAWVVEKPTRDGKVTSIELYDEQDALVCQFFGLRKPGVPQLETWRDLVADLPRIEYNQQP